ncbi:sulfite exporter TauE/SafE family protein [Streptosporangium sandarakinum]|uniref:sulfite exporter TauE/SafE family protein n=1 Tax=Streptosporangium sandarakinum TaxID=1260955 RepID=UPI00344A2D55
MTWSDTVFLTTMGVASGALNTVVAGGSLVSFPALIWLGYPPLLANVINGLGLLPGGISGAYGYRTWLPKQPALLVKIIVVAVAGGLVGSVLLLSLPARYFATATPVLILAATALAAAQPLMSRRTRRESGVPAGETVSPASRPALVLVPAGSGPAPAGAGPDPAGDGPAAEVPANVDNVDTAAADPDRHAATGASHPGRLRRLGPWAMMLAVSVYGGYWVVALGVLLFSVFNVAFPRMSLQQINALKILSATTINATGTVVFIMTGHLLPVWQPVLLLGAGALLGGWVGAVLGRRLRASYLRTLVMVIGLFSAIWLLT